MRTVMQKGAARVLALFLCLTMLLGMVPASMAAAEDTGSSGDTQARIVHLDMGRKYFTADWIKSLIDKMALYGYNQLELDFGNSGAGQLRFKLDNMDVTYNATVTEMMPVQQETLEEPADAEQPTDAIEQPADATEQPTDATEQPADATEQPTDATEQPADATEQPTDEVKALVEEVALQNETVGVTGSDVMEFEARNTTVEKTVNLDSAFVEGEYLNETEMAGIIDYANQNGIEIVPLLNSPGHFGAVLAGVEDAETGETVDLRYPGSNSSLDITNPDATAFGLAVVKKYAQWFYGQDCRTFNIGADEFANDTGSMGFATFDQTLWSNFDTYITDLYNMLTGIGYDTVRMFNDSVNYGYHTSTFPEDIQVCYWSCGWSGYDLSAASELADAGYSLINTNSTYYYVLREPNNRNSIPEESVILANFSNESFIGSNGTTDTVTKAAGSMFCIWCDYPDGTTQEQVMNEISAPLAAMAYQMQGGETGTGLTYELFKEYGINAEVDLGYTSEQNVSVKEGASTEVKVPNVDLSGTYTADDPDVASVSVQYYNQEAGTSYTFAPVGSISRDGQYVIKSKGYYLTLNNGSLGATTNVEEAALWTAGSSGGGYLYSNGYYLRYNDGLTTTTSSRNATSWSFDGSKGLHYAEQVLWWTTNYYITCSNGRWTASTDGSNQVGTRNTESTAARDESVITFNGLSAGETSVIIGDVKYNITVTRELNAEPLTVEYWITNAGVNGSSTDSQSIQIEAEAVYGENGVDLSTLVDQTGMWGEQQVVLWKTTVLDYNNHQSGDPGDDETADGDDFTLIRYWNDRWQYYYNNSWQTITTSGYYADQVVAYYLQVTDVTTEVTTLTKDWGYSTDTTTPDTSSRQGQVALAFAVVYPDGTLSPATEDLIYDKATIFNYWGGRNFGIISVQNNSDYTVSKITVTDGRRTRNTSANVWHPTDTITWEKKQLDSGSYWYDETVAWEKSQGGVPTVYGNGYEWTAKNQATLILIYLEPTQSEDNLTVNYEVEDSGTPFYSFDVKVTNTTGQEEKTFLNSLVNGNYPVNVGSINLDDAAYVVNSSGVQQKFNKDLTTVPALVNTIYGSGLFTYTGASISADGKTLTLTYRKNAASQYQYVVDFGLPVRVLLTELGINPQGVTSVSGTASYGAISYDAASQSITYTPNSILKTTATAQLTVTFGDGQQQRVTVDFVPASTVYYEAEDFVSTAGAWSEAGTSGSRTQAATKLGEETNNYGYDAAYDNNANGWSNGNADKVTVDTATYNNGGWPTASFSFTGTGVDIISQTDVKAGAILVDVKDGSNTPVKQYIVNNYYGYTYSEETGWTVSDKNGNGISSIYQVPVIAVRGLKHGTYNVTITVVYDDLFDVANKDSFDFYLDAIRVYNTLADSSVYATDHENNPAFVPVHNRVTATAATLVDGKTNANLEEFTYFGPNNEVYLAPDQSVTLTMEGDETGKAQLAARIISGTGTASLALSNGQTVNVKSTVDEYYKVASINNTVTIENTGNCTIAVTMLKIFGRVQ